MKPPGIIHPNNSIESKSSSESMQGRRKLEKSDIFLSASEKNDCREIIPNNSEKKVNNELVKSKLREVYGNRKLVPRKKKEFFIFLFNQALKNDRNIIIETIIELWEKYFPDSNSHNNILQLIESICDKYTPLQQATWNGSKRCIQILISKGANLDSINHKGESIDVMLLNGKIYSISKDPGLREFIANRYDECKEYIDSIRRMRASKDEKISGEVEIDIPSNIMSEIRLISEELEEIIDKILSNEKDIGLLYYRAAESILNPELLSELQTILRDNKFYY